MPNENFVKAVQVVRNTPRLVWALALVLVGFFLIASSYSPGGSWGGGPLERMRGSGSYGSSINPFLAALGGTSLVGGYMVYRSRK